VPFKFNYEWLQEDVFQKLAIDNWKHYDSTLSSLATNQFIGNLKLIKKLTVEWDCQQKDKCQRELLEIEEKNNKFYVGNLVGIFSEGDIAELQVLEGRKASWLAKEEVKWKLKICALWLNEGDGNTKFFHKYANHGKVINTIWELNGSNGSNIRYFHDLSKDRVKYFENLFKDTEESCIVDQMRIVRSFPRVFNQESIERE
jgi:hypothetical protein